MPKEEKRAPLRADMHVHTRFSCDSTEEMDAYCVRAVQSGVDIVCFTEHIDYNPCDNGYNYYRAEEYFETVQNMRERYGGTLKILTGIEFSEPQLYTRELDALLRYPYDFVLGSIHFWVGDLFPSQMTRAGVSAEECFEKYWAAMRDMTACGHFDCIGHLDFPKRYYGCLRYDREMLTQILRTAVQGGLILELNTSSLRRGLPSMMPEDELLRLYRGCGGQYVTVGSDAHRAADLGADGDAARASLRSLGLTEVYFERRRMIRLP